MALETGRNGNRRPQSWGRGVGEASVNPTLSTAHVTLMGHSMSVGSSNAMGQLPLRKHKTVPSII